jgi:hypothetical protein
LHLTGKKLHLTGKKLHLDKSNPIKSIGCEYGKVFKSIKTKTTTEKKIKSRCFYRKISKQPPQNL